MNMKRNFITIVVCDFPAYQSNTFNAKTANDSFKNSMWRWCNIYKICFIIGYATRCTHIDTNWFSSRGKVHHLEISFFSRLPSIQITSLDEFEDESKEVWAKVVDKISSGKKDEYWKEWWSKAGVILEIRQRPKMPKIAGTLIKEYIGIISW